MNSPSHDPKKRDSCDHYLDFKQFLHLPRRNEVDDWEVKNDEENESDETWCGDTRTNSL